MDSLFFLAEILVYPYQMQALRNRVAQMVIKKAKKSDSKQTNFVDEVMDDVKNSKSI